MCERAGVEGRAHMALLGPEEPFNVVGVKGAAAALQRGERGAPQLVAGRAVGVAAAQLICHAQRQIHHLLRLRLPPPAQQSSVALDIFASKTGTLLTQIFRCCCCRPTLTSTFNVRIECKYVLYG